MSEDWAGPCLLRGKTAFHKVVWVRRFLSLGEDEPRVLYILPWQAPSLPKRPRADLNDEAPELVRPVDPVVLERHRLFRENLNPLILSPVGDSGLAEQ